MTTIQNGDWEAFAAAANEDAVRSPEPACPPGAHGCGMGTCGCHDCRDCYPTTFCDDCDEMKEFCQCEFNESDPEARDGDDDGEDVQG